MCVEVDITKPLISKFVLRRKIRRIKYEGLHLICFNCGVYGHTIDQCKKGEEENEPVEIADNNNNQGDEINKIFRNQETMARPEIVDDYGPWMIARKPTRRTNARLGNREQGGSTARVQGSRFGILEDNHVET